MKLCTFHAYLKGLYFQYKKVRGKMQRDEGILRMDHLLSLNNRSGQMASRNQLREKFKMENIFKNLYYISAENTVLVVYSYFKELKV